MAFTNQTEEEVTLKLLVKNDTNKVLFAEAEKEFVDVLFSFLILPLGTITRLLEKDSSMGPVTFGSLNSLYHCLGTRITTEMLLQPANSSEYYCSTLKLNIDDTEPTKYFRCPKFPSCDGYGLSFSTNKCKCRECGNPLNRQVLMKHSIFYSGFVKSGATFIITDNLTVMPNSMDVTTFCLLQNFGIKSASSVKEMTVNITKEKMLDLLKCSLFSKTPLTDLFIAMKKPPIERLWFLSCDFENTSNDIQLSVKLVIRKSDGKLLYAQGEHDFADILLNFLAIPVGGIVRLFGGNSLGSLDALHNS